MAHLEGGLRATRQALGDLASDRLRFAQAIAVRPDRRAFAQVDSRFGQVELGLDGLGRGRLTVFSGG